MLIRKSYQEGAEMIRTLFLDVSPQRQTLV